MSRPLIGITTSYVDDERPRQCLDGDYVEVVEAAGGCPVLLAMPRSGETLQPLLHQIDGLVITGGPAICDRLVGELPDDIQVTPARRHVTDLFAYQVMEQRQRPILGICYGMQFINARHGGSISADLQTYYGVEAHSPLRYDGEDLFHNITVAAGTHLAAAIGGGQQRVNSYHIQAVVDAGAPLRVSARSADGIIEGIESADGRVLGVQFHPERLGGAGAGLFRQLVERASG